MQRTHGIYWILANNLAGRERDEFTNFFGHVFEAYVCRSLTRAAGRGFCRGVEYDGADEGKRPEGALVTPRSVALLNTRDVESIEAIIKDGAAWPDYLTRKHTERHLNDSFHNYVCSAFGG